MLQELLFLGKTSSNLGTRKLDEKWEHLHWLWAIYGIVLSEIEFKGGGSGIMLSPSPQN